MSEARTYWIERHDQLQTLASPARVEIIDALASLPRSSVAALADALGRPADSLYYHLRALTRAGLVKAVGVKSGPRRPGTLYSAVAPRVAVRYDARSPRHVAGMRRTAASLMRTGARDFRRAYRPGNAVTEGPLRELWVARATGRLGAADVRRVNRLFKEILGVLEASRRRATGRLFAVTFLLVPLAPAARDARSSRS